MAKTYRRSFLKPADLAADAAAQLAEKLAAAIDAQRTFSSQSPHVLQLTSGLQEDEHSFYVEHEPAEPLVSAADLFKADKAHATEDMLLRVTVAVFDALRVAHAAKPPLLNVHGGMCPGAILTTPDGIEKVSDFGYPPAVCAAVGSQEYLNLGVRQPPGTGDDIQVTGQWEILPPDEYDREDRICSFVDPEKYRTQILGGFEAGSDIIAAGFILHLMAEHRHPYLDEADAHRMVEMSEFMAMSRYNGARRQDLRESANPAIKVWCEQVAKTLAILPQDRPSAEQVCEALGAVGCKPVDATETLRRQIEARIKQIEQSPAEKIAWAEERSFFQTVLDSEAMPQELLSKAQGIVAQADSFDLLASAEAHLSGGEWHKAEGPINRLHAMPDLRPDVKGKVDALWSRLQSYQRAEKEVNSIEAEVDNLSTDDPTAGLALIDALQNRVAALTIDDALQDSLGIRKDKLLTTLKERHESLTAAAESLEADREAAQGWLDRLEEAAQRDAWDEFQILLDDRPELNHWPSAIVTQVDQLKQRHADHQAAEKWLATLEEQVQRGAWEEAQAALDTKPAIDAWPHRVSARADELATQIRREVETARQHAQAVRWIDELRQAVESEDWAQAGTLAASQPELEHWPEGINEQAAALREKIEAHLAEQERLRLAKEEAERQARAWLKQASNAAEAKDYEGALRRLANPPQLEHFSDAVRKEADKLAAQCEAKRLEQLEKKHQARIHSIRTQTAEFVSGLVKKKLATYLSPDQLDIQVEAIEFDAPDAPTGGVAKVSVAPRNRPATGAGHAFEGPIAIALKGDVARVVDDDGNIQASLVTHLTDWLTEYQRSSIAGPFEHLRKGPFPKCQVNARIDKPVKQTAASVALDGTDQPGSTVQTVLAWDAATLAWRLADARGFVQTVSDLALSLAREVVEARVLEASPLLRRYKPAFKIDVSGTPVKELADLGKPFSWKVNLSLRPGRQAKPTPLQSVPLTCKEFGVLSFDAPLKQAEANLHKVVLPAQSASHDALLEDLRAKTQEAPGKVKMTSMPKRFSQPVDETSVELRCLKRAPAVVRAKWNTETFEFEPVNSWVEELKAVNAPLASDEKKRSMAMPAGIAAVVLAVVAIAVAGIATRGRNDQQLVRQDNHNAPTRTTEGPDNTPIGRNDDATRPEDDSVNTPIDTENTSENPDRKPAEDVTEQPTNPTGTADTNSDTTNTPDNNRPASDHDTSPEDTDNTPTAPEPTPPTVTADDRRAVQDAIKGSLDLNQFAGLIEPDGIEVRWDDAPTWVKEDNGWQSNDSTARVRLVGDETHNPLATIPLSLRADDGGISLPEIPEDALRPVDERIRNALREHQQTALTQRVEELRNTLTDQSVAAESLKVTRSDSTELPGTSADLAVTWDGLQPRRFVLEWDPADLDFRFDVGWQAEATLTAVAHDVVASLRESLPSDHWLSAAAPASIFELHPPTRDRWILGAVAPWATNAEDAPSNPSVTLPLTVTEPYTWLDNEVTPDVLAPRILARAIEKPAYWPLVTEYLLCRDPSNAFALNMMTTAELQLIAQDDSLDATTQAEFNSEVVPYWQNAKFVQPYLELVPGSGKATADEQGPQQLELTLRGRWGLNMPGDRRPTPIQADAVDDLNTDVRELFTAEECTLTLTAPAGSVVRRWSDVVPLVTGFVVTVEMAEALDNKLAALDTRQVVEDAFESKLDGNDSIVLDEATAFDLLGQVWAAKGVGAAPEASLTEFTSDLQAKLGRRGQMGKSARITPTVFAEYYCGPHATYALVWSKTPAGTTLAEGPSLVRLTSLTEIASEQAENNQSNLGASLLTPIFDKVPEACQAPSFGQFDFASQVGIVLAPDGRMGFLNVANLTFEPQQSFLQAIRVTAGAQSDEREWRTLSELESGQELRDRLCGYRLVASLTKLTPWRTLAGTARETQRWATQVVDDAVGPAP